MVALWLVGGIRGTSQCRFMKALFTRTLWVSAQVTEKDLSAEVKGQPLLCHLLLPPLAPPRHTSLDRRDRTGSQLTQGGETARLPA